MNKHEIVNETIEIMSQLDTELEVVNAKVLKMRTILTKAKTKELDIETLDDIFYSIEMTTGYIENMISVPLSNLSYEIRSIASSKESCQDE